MIGYITTPEAAAQILAEIRDAFTVRDLPPFWTPGSFPIYTGPHVGQHFIPADDNIFQTPLTGNPPSRPMDYPDFQQIIAAMGGLEARVELDPSAILPPEEP
jgi:hypothetical protein